MSKAKANLPGIGMAQPASTWDIVYFPLGASAFGGAERSVIELATAQQATGLRVLICYERALQKGDFITQAKARNLALQLVDWSPEDSFTHVARTAWQAFRQLNTRLIHFNVAWRRHMWLIPLLARIASRARLIATMRVLPDRADRIPRRRHFGIIPGLRLWTLPDHAIARIWAKTMHLTVSVNRDSFPPRMIREFGFSQRRLRVVFNGVPFPDRMPDQNARRAAKGFFGFSEDAFIAAYVGRISEEKGIRYAIEAMSISDQSVKLLIAGEGDQLDELKALTEKLGLSERVRFVGYVSDPFLAFSAAEVALVPSVSNEAFGRVVVEAMACGTVVIATAVGGMQELFTDSREGFYVPTANPTAISDAVNKLNRNRAQWAQMSSAGRLLVEARYATQRVASDYRKIYAELVEGIDSSANPNYIKDGKTNFES